MMGSLSCIMSNMLCALDKCSGVRPLGIIEIYYRLWAKCILAVAGHEVKTACGKDELCTGLEAGIDGTVHAVSSLWEYNEDDDKWVFLLVDARNAFNEINMTATMWTVRHLWPLGARFTFNCYRHHSLLLVRAKNGDDDTFLLSKEGFAQGDPLAMIVYGIGALPLYRTITDEVPEYYQPWYADDAGAGDKFDNILRYYLTKA